MYQPLTELPVPSKAHFVGSNVIQVSSTVHDHGRNIKRTISNSLVLTNSSVIASPVQTVTEEIASVYSPSGQRRAVLRECKDQKNAKRIVEIWQKDKIEASIDVTERHGPFYAEEFVASLAFSHSETSLVYIAEANLPEGTTDHPYRKFRFRPPFGEGYPPDANNRPEIFVFFWKNGLGEPSRKLARLDNTSAVLFGQVIFGPHDDVLYATGFEHTPSHRLLGVKYCFNHPSGIWELTPSSLHEPKSNKETTPLKFTSKKLSPSHLSCRSPRIISHHKKSTLVWFSQPTGGAHVATSTIYSLDITSIPKLTELPSPLVDIAREPTNGEFPGLYPEANFTSNPILRLATSPAPYLAITSTWGSRNTVLLISTADGSVKDVTPEDGNLYSWRVLNTDNESRIVCVRSTPLTPPEFVLGQFDHSGEVSWRVIQKPEVDPNLKSELSNLRASVIPIPGRLPTETIVIRSAVEPKTKRDIRPCIMMPHGGPHGTTLTAFTPNVLALALEGFTISMPNYTGSLGFGESAILALIGKCGTLDVEDCIASARHLIELGISVKGAGKQLVMGGSHGGFLSGHLLGQYPDFFSAAVIRNPVMSVGEITNSDIPDWYFAEFGLEYPIYSSPAFWEIGEQAPRRSPPPKNTRRAPMMLPETYERLYKRSPVAHVDAVRASVLLLVGTVDQRVSPTQGVGYYHALMDRAREGQRIELLMFEGESHPLEGVEAARVGWEATRDFFKWAQTLEVQFQSSA